jgi:hypothetical protein
LKLDHQLNQLVLAQALQISPFHEHMDSEIALRGKGVGKYAGGIVSLVDETIDMNGHHCGTLLGNIDFVIKYGYPGKEIFYLYVKGDITVGMDARGAVTSTLLGHAPYQGGNVLIEA